MNRVITSISTVILLALTAFWGIFQPSTPTTAAPVDGLPAIIEELPVPVLAYVNTTRIDEDGRQIVVNVDSIMVLVNKKRNLPRDYVPTDLYAPKVPFTFPNDEPRRYMRYEAALALERMFAAAKEQNLHLYATSGYRSYDKQAELFRNQAKKVGEVEANRYVAHPGQSEHQTGLAMDITCLNVGLGLYTSFGDTPEGIWLSENAHRFGFIIRYPLGKEHITGYGYEPWHVRYVGIEEAEYMYTHNLTLEEYFAEVYGY